MTAAGTFLPFRHLFSFKCIATFYSFLVFQVFLGVNKGGYGCQNVGFCYVLMFFLICDMIEKVKKKKNQP